MRFGVNVLFSLCLVACLTTSSLAQDSDGDSVPDAFDNCILTPNGPSLGACDHRDGNLDGYGNACDTDTNDDGGTGLDDMAMTLSFLGTMDPRFDFNCDDGVGLDDMAIQLNQLGQAPGPSYLACAGTIPCVAGPLPLFEVGPPLFEEGALPAGAVGDTTFFVHIRTTNKSAYPTSLAIDSVSLVDDSGNVVAPLWDTGDAVDETALDGVYTTSFSYDGRSLSAGDCEVFKASAETLSGSIESEPVTFCATEQARGLAEWSPSLLQDSADTPIAGSDGFIVYLEEDASESDLESLATVIDADIVGSKLNLGFFQLRLRTPATDLVTLNATLATIQANVSVAAASRDLLYSPHAGFGAYQAPEFRGPLDFNHLARIRADEAWFLNQGGESTIAVIDSGAEPLSPDLQGRLLTGRTFVPGETSTDDDSATAHGTKVASMAAGALSADGYGVIGVAPRSKILIAKVFDSAPEESKTVTLITRVVSAIEWVSRQDVDVVVMSLGPTDPTQINASEWSPICRAIAAAPSHMLFVASAGNENFAIAGVGNTYAPASCAGVLTVAGTMRNSAGEEVRWVDDAVHGSNYGGRIDISAPAKDLPYQHGGETTITATSFAAPLVAGAAALMMHADPALDAAEVRDRLKASSQTMPGVAGMGEGFLDVFEALTNAGFERDGQRNLSWDESNSWNDREFVKSQYWVTSLTHFIDDTTRYLASMETEFGDIEPTSGDWMVVIPNGTTPYTSSPGFDGTSQTVYETGFLGIDFDIIDLGEGGQLPIRFDWALVAALEASDIPCIAGSEADCLYYTSGEPVHLSAGSGGNLFYWDEYGVMTPFSRINLFPESATTATLPMTTNPSTWTGWQEFSGEFAAIPYQNTSMIFVNSPVGYRILPDSSSDLANPDWIDEPTNFSLLVDSLEFRSP